MIRVLWEEEYGNRCSTGSIRWISVSVRLPGSTGKAFFDAM